AGPAIIGLPGRWEARVVVQRAGAYDLNDRFELPVARPGPATASAGPVRPGALVDPVVAGTALLAAIAAAVLFRRSGRQLAASRRLLADTMPPAPARRPGGPPCHSA